MVARTDIPPLSARDSELLGALLEADCSLPALAARTSTPLGDLLDWAETPAVATRIASAQRLANLHSTLTAPSSRLRAIAALEALLADKSNAIETRRTATAILRALDGKPDRQGGRPARRRPNVHQLRSGPGSRVLWLIHPHRRSPSPSHPLLSPLPPLKPATTAPARDSFAPPSNS
jgi:hypothetical protein